ncbi:MAG: alpha/beta fold hydrolase [Balneolaceae bacterium]
MKLFVNHIFYHLEIHQNSKNKPYLLFLHGFMGSGKVFDKIIPLITEFCNPVTIDLLGHGMTEGTEDPSRFECEHQVNDLISILDRLKLKNLFLYGYSMGARLSLQTILHSAKFFSGCILESTHCGIENLKERQERRIIDKKRADSILQEFDQFLKNWNEKQLFKCSSDKSSAGYKTIQMSQKPEYMAASLLGFGAGTMPPVCEKLSQLKLPVLCLAGSEDQKYAESMRKLSGLFSEADFKVIPKSGHRIHLDQPKSAANEIKPFLKR